MLNYKVIKKNFPANNSYITAITIIPVKRNINQFLNGDFARLKEVREWFLEGFEKILKNNVEEPLIMEGDEVELEIGKIYTKIRFTLHENLDVPLESFRDTALPLEDIIDTKELYDIMLEWNKILDEK